jgi:DNA topoisomerase VI subunit A
MDNDPHGLDIYAVYKWGARVNIVYNRYIFIRKLILFIYIYVVVRI